MNAALQHRLRFVDFLLDHYSHVMPRHLMDYFGIGSAQATRDLRMYLAYADGNAEYDESAKLYRKKPTFERVWE
jgi:hypothetical protein